MSEPEVKAFLSALAGLPANTRRGILGSDGPEPLKLNEGILSHLELGCDGERITVESRLMLSLISTARQAQGTSRLLEPLTQVYPGTTEREVLGQLIATADELAELKSAMAHVHASGNCGASIMVPDQILEWATDLGWAPSAARASLESRGDATRALLSWLVPELELAQKRATDWIMSETGTRASGRAQALHDVFVMLTESPAPSAAGAEPMAGWERVPRLPLDKGGEINLPDSDVWVLISTEDGSDMLMAKSEWTDDSEGNGEPYWETGGGDLALCNYPFWRSLPSPPKVTP